MDTIRFAFEFAGGDKTLSVLLVVFILCAVGVWMHWTGNPAYTAIFGGTISTTTTGAWESLAATEAIDKISYSKLIDSSEWNLYGSNVATEFYAKTPLEFCGANLPYHIDGWPSTGGVVLWRGTVPPTGLNKNEFMDCGYTPNATALNGTTFADKLASLRAEAPSLCRDDLMMENGNARGEYIRRARGEWVHFTMDASNWKVAYPHLLDSFSDCDVLFDSTTKERIYCTDAEQVFNTDLNCSTTIMPVMSTHSNTQAVSGIRGFFAGVDMVFYSLFGAIDQIPVLNLFLPALSNGALDALTLYETARDSFVAIIMIAAILFVLTCVWAVYASHRTL